MNSIKLQKQKRKRYIRNRKSCRERKNLIYRASEYTYSFKNFKTIKIFGRDIYNGEITLQGADEGQGNLLVEILNFKNKTKPQNPEKNQKKDEVLTKLVCNF